MAGAATCAGSSVFGPDLVWAVVFVRIELKAIVILLLWPGLGLASCSSWVVGFKGLRSDFDHAAFVTWAQKRAECYRVYEWYERTQSLNFLQSLSVPYDLYGFSKGAETVLWLMPRLETRPRYVITIGGWRTVNFDFGHWQVPFHNWFDRSGAGNTSPGTHVLNVQHRDMQAWVNQFYLDSIVK